MQSRYNHLSLIFHFVHFHENLDQLWDEFCFLVCIQNFDTWTVGLMESDAVTGCEESVTTRELGNA